MARTNEFKMVDVVFDPDAEVIEILLRDHEVRMYPSKLGSFTAVAIHKKQNPKREIPDDNCTDDFTPVKALARLAYKIVFRQIVKWVDRLPAEQRSDQIVSMRIDCGRKRLVSVDAQPPYPPCECTLHAGQEVGKEVDDVEG